jgi:hypothetical protein
MVETCNELRSSSVRTTYSLFHHMAIPKVLVNPRSRRLLALNQVLI